MESGTDGVQGAAFQVPVVSLTLRAGCLAPHYSFGVTLANSGIRSCPDTTTPPGFSIVIANWNTSEAAILASIGISCSASVMLKTPPSIGYF